MVLSAEEKKKRNAEASKKWREKNKEYFKEYNKKYYNQNKEKILEHHKEYNKTPQGIKSFTISHWKNFGLVHEDYDALYKTYIETKECNVCKKVFETSYDRCLDHDHTTGLFRQILCRGCNNLDSWKNKV